MTAGIAAAERSQDQVVRLGDGLPLLRGGAGTALDLAGEVPASLASDVAFSVDGDGPGLHYAQWSMSYGGGFTRLTRRGMLAKNGSSALFSELGST